MRNSSLHTIIAIMLNIICLCGCDVMAKRLANVGRPPAFNDINSYESAPKEPQDKRDVPTWTDNSDLSQASTTYHPPKKKANTLWRPGARSFFRDQRARSVGDILKVKIELQDNAKLDNKTERKRTGNSSMGVPKLFGLERYAGKINSALDPTKVIGLNSDDGSSGTGKVDRKETINTTIAAMVVKKIPNGNLIIKGTQEIRVNYELREITIKGIVRPEDINSDNSIALEQIAEARISYGGRGHISDYQQERYGKQVLDIVSPF